MVFFTCNACGASLKKNQVAKHYQNECPTCEVLSCMDCGQDFYGDAYANHTKCISEAEKYQGALYKESGKGGAGKGERKQQEWLEQVKQSVSGAKVSPKVAGLLEKIADYPNIPRKKAKFENFVRNSFNVRDQRTLTQLWDAFSGATKKNQTSTTGIEKTVAEKQQTTLDVQAKDLTKTDITDSEVEVPKKEKKKHKDTAESPDVSETGHGIMMTNGDTGVGGDDVGDEVPRRKKKKQKTAPTANDGDDAIPAAATIVMEGGDSPVTKKVKKRKRQIAEETVDLLDTSATIDEGDGEQVPTTKKAKKKEHKHKESSGSDDCGDVLDKKRKHKAELDTGDTVLEGEIVPTKKQRRSGGLENGDAGLELSDGVSQTVVKKHKKKKHKHQKEQSLHYFF